jgi:hypothetical protein
MSSVSDMTGKPKINSSNMRRSSQMQQNHKHNDDRFLQKPQGCAALQSSTDICGGAGGPAARLEQLEQGAGQGQFDQPSAHHG